MKKGKKGATLVELIVVLSLIFIIVIIFSNFINISKKILIRAELEKFYSVLIILQRNGILERKEQELVFSLSENSYSFNGKVTKLPYILKFGVAPGVKGPPSNPESPIIKACSFVNNKIIFYPDGRISSGIIYLTDQDENITCAVTIPVSDFSYIRRYIYKDNSWTLIT